ncbi:EAL domain-containing protein [Henriciella sp. AS95]|uniref:putative bifunctional diguanylate cyclase/phosphodiesterase n=1 Tax=Henriciella sp. AS95 TaxID=3135782 RepID=UPI00317EAEF9
MQTTPYPIPANEEQRLRALAEYHLIDTPAEEQFDRLVALAARLFDVPIVLISLLDRDRQYFKARVGLDVCQTSRDVSFCAHAIARDEILFIPDAREDPRFRSNPLVLGHPHIRFYAGKPLVAPGGEKLGTVCLIDSKPRETFSNEDRANLCDLAALVMDRLEMRRLDFARTVSQSRFENIAATSPDAIICSTSDEKITFWNKSAERLYGYTAEEVLHRSAALLIPDSWRQIYDEEIQSLRAGKAMQLDNTTVELSGQRKDGSEFPAEYSLSTWAEGNGIGVGAIVRDLSDRRRNEERLFRLASLDALTELPNRAVWRKTLDQTLASDKAATVLLVDLDGFKEVNDTLGHSAGDAVLKEVASRLRSVCHDAIMVARLGGDEFVALLPGNDIQVAKDTAAELVRSISRPYIFAGKQATIGASIGVSRAPMHSERSDELLSAADLALYKAKEAGKGRYVVFTPAFREAAVARKAVQRELKLAFENGELELYYQPQVDARTQRITGAEALMRWRHPERGLLTPAAFMDVLSEKPSAAAVGEWAIREACLQARQWRDQIPGFRVGVNLFEAQFHSGDLMGAVQDALLETGLPADALELEIVETVLLSEDRKTMRLLHDLRELGVGLAFDDYGTGFASLSLLKRYPVSRLKIDRTFVRDVNSDPEDAAVVKAILYLGKSFGLDVIAEGVETKAQLDFLTNNGCTGVQGYLFGKPMPATAFSAKFLRQAA